MNNLSIRSICSIASEYQERMSLSQTMAIALLLTCALDRQNALFYQAVVSRSDPEQQLHRLNSCAYSQSHLCVEWGLLAAHVQQWKRFPDTGGSNHAGKFRGNGSYARMRACYIRFRSGKSICILISLIWRSPWRVSALMRMVGTP